MAHLFFAFLYTQLKYIKIYFHLASDLITENNYFPISFRYSRLSDIADHFFPPLHQTDKGSQVHKDQQVAIEYSSPIYWREPIVSLSETEINKFKDMTKQKTKDSVKQKRWLPGSTLSRPCSGENAPGLDTREDFVPKGQVSTFFLP